MPDPLATTGPDASAPADAGAVDPCRPGAGGRSGWDDEIGTGAVFIVDTYAIAPEALVDVDDACLGQDCRDNSLRAWSELFNGVLRQDLLGGDALLALEITGIDAPAAATDCSVTLRLYVVQDAEMPIFPANNFSVPAGRSTCCEFLVDPISVEGPSRRPRVQWPARIVQGELQTLSSVAVPQGFLPVVPTEPGLEVVMAQLTARLAPDLTTAQDAVLSGVVPARAMSTALFPFCAVASPLCPTGFPQEATFVDATSVLVGPPDIDVDGDGLECVIDTNGDGLADLCCEAAGTVDCFAVECTDPLPAVDPAQPSTCVLNGGFNDGYSVNFSLSATEASLVGFAPPRP